MRRLMLTVFCSGYRQSPSASAFSILINGVIPLKRIINKSISIAVSLSVILVLISSTFFIVQHTSHHCADKNCPVCTELANCHSNILNLGSTCATGSYLIAFAAGSIAYIFYTGCPETSNTTLISLKVELLN